MRTFDDEITLYERNITVGRAGDARWRAHLLAACPSRRIAIDRPSCESDVGGKRLPVRGARDGCPRTSRSSSWNNARIKEIIGTTRRRSVDS
jgi:hypothetical protein